MNTRLRAEAGVALVELAVSIFVFMILVLLTVDVLRFSYETAHAQYIVNTVARDAVVAAKIKDLQNSGVKIGNMLLQTTQKSGFDTSKVRFRLCSSTNCTAGSCPCAWTLGTPVPDADTGKARKMFVVGIQFDFNLSLGWKFTNIEAHAIGRNSAFSN